MCIRSVKVNIIRVNRGIRFFSIFKAAKKVERIMDMYPI